MKRALIEAKAVTKHFVVPGAWPWSGPRGQIRAVDGLSLAIRPGEAIGLVGESGCGKTTVARLILGLERPTGGSIAFDGTEIRRLSADQVRRYRATIHAVFQDPFSSLNPRMRVGEIVGEPLTVDPGVSRAQRQQRVLEALEAVGLEGMHTDYYPHEFSGGQRQRIAIARALATRPKLIILDEPVSSLDVSIRAQIVNLLKDLRARTGVAYLLIAHDLSLVSHLCDRVTVMYLGKIVESGATSDVFARPRHPYSMALRAATWTPGEYHIDPSRILEGEIPSPLRPPSGCRFRTRCPWASHRCEVEEPILRTVGGSLVACHFAEDLASSAAPPASGLHGASGEGGAGDGRGRSHEDLGRC